MSAVSRNALAVAVLAIGIAAGCSLVTSYDGFSGVDGAKECGQRIPTAPRPVGTPDKGTLVGAAQKLRYVDLPGLTPLGYDLDENCAGPACRPRAGGEPKKVGIDNSIGTFIAGLAMSSDPTGITVDLLKRGRYGIVLQITRWNGTDDDDSLTVSLYNVAGVNGSTDGGASAAFEGSDEFVAAASDLRAPPLGGSNYEDPQAHVTRKTLVARFPQLRFRTLTPVANGAFAAFDIVLVEARLVGKIALVAGGIRMDDAQLVGRAPETGVLRNLSQLGLCRDGGSYAPTKGSVCGRLDLTESKVTDGKNQKCVAGSFAIGLTILPAKLASAPAPLEVESDFCNGEPADTCGP
jgi:hypothetical protein